MPGNTYALGIVERCLAKSPDRRFQSGRELADAMIRIADLCGWFGLEIEYAIRVKGDYNETRPRKHGKNF